MCIVYVRVNADTCIYIYAWLTTKHETQIKQYRYQTFHNQMRVFCFIKKGHKTVFPFDNSRSRQSPSLKIIPHNLP